VPRVQLDRSVTVLYGFCELLKHDHGLRACKELAEGVLTIAEVDGVGFIELDCPSVELNRLLVVALHLLFVSKVLLSEDERKSDGKKLTLRASGSFSSTFFEPPFFLFFPIFKICFKNYK
jgi:hypothetical protein